MQITRRPRHLVLPAIVAALLTGACSSGEPSPQGPANPPGAGDDPLARVLAASDAALEAESMHMTFEITMDGSGQQIHGSGEADVAFGDEMRQHATFRYDSFPGLPGGLEMEMIVDGSMLYMRMPQLQQMGGAPTEWLSMDMSTVVPGYEQLLEMGAGRNDPANAFGYLQGAENVDEVGAETVNGVETTHFRGFIDLADAITQVPKDMRRDMRLVVEQMREQAGTLTMPFDIWIDDDGLLRRMVFAMQAEGDVAGAFSMTTTMDVTEYGNEFELEIPPADEVTDLTDLAERRGAGW